MALSYILVSNSAMSSFVLATLALILRAVLGGAGIIICSARIQGYSRGIFPDRFHC